VLEEQDLAIDQVPLPLIWSIDQQFPVIVNDITAITEHSFGIKLPTIAEIILPLVIGDQCMGALDICSDVANVFGPETLNGFHLLSLNTAVAFHNADIHHSEYVKRAIYERLHQSVGRLSPDISLGSVSELLLDELGKVLPWDAAGIWLYKTAENQSDIDIYRSTLRLAEYRLSEQSIETSSSKNIPSIADFADKYAERTFDEEELITIYPWFTEIIGSINPVIKENEAVFEPFGDILGFEVDYSAIGSPLFDGSGQALGLILAVSHKSGQYDSESVNLIKSFSDIAAIALENARNYTAAHDQAWISTVLLQVAEATQSITNLDELLETVVSMLPGLINAEGCVIFLWDPHIEAFFPRTSSGFSEDQTARLMAVEIFEGTIPAFEKLKESTSPIIFTDESVPIEFSTQVFPEKDLRKDLMILFPLISQNGLCGAMLLDFSDSTFSMDSPQDVWDEEFTLIEGAARQTAAAIENLQLIKSQEEEAYTSIALLQVAQAVVSSKELSEILSSIVRITPILVGVKRCIIYLWDAQELVFRQSEYFGFSKSELALLGQVIRADEFPLIEGIQVSKQIIYHSLSHDGSPTGWSEITLDGCQFVDTAASEEGDDISVELDSQSLRVREKLLIGFPLSVKDEVLGVMLIEEEDPVRGTPSLHIREKRIEIVKGITQQAAIAIKNDLLQQEAVKSERMERELQLAREIQVTFLPDRLPELPGWDISAHWQPARQVSGDFYDVLKLDGNRIGLVIADVADKGMPAALFMTLIRTLIRSTAKEKPSPAPVLKQVNDLLFPDSKHGLFVTVFYGVISLDTGEFVYANAGHNPPIVVNTSHEGLVELTRTSIALGIFDDIEVTERCIQIKPGDFVFFYTDGITEAFSVHEEMFGTQRLFDLLSDHGFTSCADLLEMIVKSVLEFIRGAEISDDMTLAAIYRKID
jgi:serine phosphatase RsbU (regulator of sigma subunit)